LKTEAIDESKEMELDFSSFVRLAVSGAQEDLRLFLAKLIRKYRGRNPAFAAKLDQELRASQTRSVGPAIMRRSPSPASPVETVLPIDTDTRLSLIRVYDDVGGIQAPILTDELWRQIQSLVTERQERDKLAAHGIRPSRSAVLVGPPGVGKTLSARWIAAQIGKPLWVLDLTAVMSSLLGKTGNNLRAVFDHAKAHEAILLLDEIDAIAKRRSDESDVGELKRLVTAILQEVDAWPDSGLLLAATNHPELIDPALWRRFDAILRFDVSGPDAVLAAVRRFLGNDLSRYAEWADVIAAGLHGSSLSDVERAVTSLRRQAILTGSRIEDLVVDLVSARTKHLDKAAKKSFAIELARSQQLSFNKIYELTGVSRDTLRKYAGPSIIRGRAKRKGV
jgi:SpoVK/Ycf46/Vps4 family AAA+-type ATPase